MKKKQTCLFVAAGMLATNFLFASGQQNSPKVPARSASTKDGLITKTIGVVDSTKIKDSIANLRKKSINTSVFSIDLSTPKKSSVTSNISRRSLEVNTSQPLMFELKNGNPFRYKYVINTSMISFFTEGINPLDSAAATKRNQDRANELAENVKDDRKVAEEKLNKKIDSLTAKNKELTTQIPAAPDPSSKNKTNPTKQELKDSVSTNKGKIEHYKDSIKTVDALFFQKLSTYLNSNVANNSNYQAETKQLNIKVDSTDRSKKATLLTLKKNAVIVNQKALTLSADIKDYNTTLLTEDYIDIGLFKAKRDTFRNQYTTLLSSINKLDTVADAVDIDAGYKTIRKEIGTYMKEMQDILHRFLGIRLENYIMPVDFNGKNIDLVKVTIERHEAKSAALIDKYDYQIWVRGGLKFDISGGAFITSLVNNKYVTIDTTVNGTAKKYIYKSNTGRFEIGFGSMLNVSYRTGSSWIRPVINIGALFSNEQKFQFLTGVGAMLGKEQRLIFHYGLSMGNVTKLEVPYKESSETSKIVYDLGNNNQVPTAQRFEFGHYFGITYNFGGPKAKVPGLKDN